MSATLLYVPCPEGIYYTFRVELASEELRNMVTPHLGHSVWGELLLLENEVTR